MAGGGSGGQQGGPRSDDRPRPAAGGGEPRVAARSAAGPAVEARRLKPPGPSSYPGHIGRDDERAGRRLPEVLE